METTIMWYILGLFFVGLYWGYMWTIENKMETTILSSAFRNFLKLRSL